MTPKDNERFSYSRTWVEIEELLFIAEQEQNHHYMLMQSGNKKDRVPHMRNYKGLEGAINGLRWVLGDLKITKNKVLGRDKK
tara:strand:+ start:6506 stop:6751 length:246 start_codon:yes stop_codon:yes gene_type:complete